MPRTNSTTLGDRAFRVAAPKLWNSLPKDVPSYNDVGVFKSKVKTHYFGVAYNWLHILLVLQLLDNCLDYVGVFN